MKKIHVLLLIVLAILLSASVSPSAFTYAVQSNFHNQIVNARSGCRINYNPDIMGGPYYVWSPDSIVITPAGDSEWRAVEIFEDCIERNSPDVTEPSR
jgi:hypothetical protein